MFKDVKKLLSTGQVQIVFEKDKAKNNTLTHSFEVGGNFNSDISKSGVLLPLRSLYVSLCQRQNVSSLIWSDRTSGWIVI